MVIHKRKWFWSALCITIVLLAATCGIIWALLPAPSVSAKLDLDRQGAQLVFALRTDGVLETLLLELDGTPSYYTTVYGDLMPVPIEDHTGKLYKKVETKLSLWQNIEMRRIIHDLSKYPGNTSYNMPIGTGTYAYGYINGKVYGTTYSPGEKLRDSHFGKWLALEGTLLPQLEALIDKMLALSQLERDERGNVIFNRIGG